MGLHSEITADIAEAFNTDLSDAVKPFTITRTITTQTDDDWLANGTGSTTSTVTINGRGVFGSYKEIEIDNQTIMANDVKLTALQAEVNGRPQVDDALNGYQVVAVAQDPADVTYTLQLRKV